MKDFIGFLITGLLFVIVLGVILAVVAGFYGALVYGIVTVAKWAWLA